MDALLLVLLVGAVAALAGAWVTLRRRDEQLAVAQLTAERLEQRAGLAERGRDELQKDADELRDLLRIGALRVTAGMKVDMANRAAHELLDRPLGALVGRSVLEAFVDRRAEEIVERASDGSSATEEIAVGGSDGRRLLLHARRGPAASTWVLIEDVTELRRLQQIRAEFVDNVSHELRTPLSTVSLLAETLAREADAVGVPGRMRDRIAKIEIETGHLVQMVNELLDLARIEGGGALVRREGIDLGKLAASATERLRLFAERQRVQLVVDVEPGLPPVVGDPERLGQVFVNLVHNAVKFSPDGGDVTVRVRQATGGVIASVEDHGVGIPKNDRARVFERFYKVDRARTRGSGGGTGLGLSIARHVVQQHGGRIWVESRVGAGSTFAFFLPTTGASVAGAPAETAASEPAAVP